MSISDADSDLLRAIEEMESGVKDKNQKTVIIVTKDSSSKGGVANYFRLFFSKYYDESIRIRRFVIGSRSVNYYSKKFRVITYLYQYCRDLVNFAKLVLLNPEVGLVQLNPSLIPVPLVRDGILLLVAKAAGVKVLVFFRGWDANLAQTFDMNPVLRRLFMSVYNQADKTLVLADRFKEYLVRWGMNDESVVISRTMFDGELPQSAGSKQKPDCPHFLFLSRIAESKGVFDILRAAAITKSKGYSFRITFVGHAKKPWVLDKLKNSFATLSLSDFCDFKSYIDGEEKSQEYSRADIFLFPSYHPEGCPNAVIEAMAAGLFVISTDVGALREIVEEGVNGTFVEKRNPQDLSDKMIWAIEKINTIRKSAYHNTAYSFKNFEATVIINQIKEIYRELLLS